MVLWAIFGLVHVGIIIVRFVKRSPPTNVLYSGAVESKISLPMSIMMASVVLISIIGLALFHAGHESITCTADFKAVKNAAITYIVFGLFMLMRITKGHTHNAATTAA